MLTIKVISHPPIWRLYVQSLAGLNPVGERLSRSEAFTVGQTQFLDKAQAHLAAARLQTHLDQFQEKKGKRNR